jgi:hypothetical protein
LRVGVPGDGRERFEGFNDAFLSVRGAEGCGAKKGTEELEVPIPKDTVFPSLVEKQIGREQTVEVGRGGAAVARHDQFTFRQL